MDERAMDERAMDERAMDAAMNPCEERHRDEYERHFNSVGPGKGLAVYFKENLFHHVTDITEDNNATDQNGNR